MSTGTVIIERALQLIGANSVVAPATPDSIVLGMENLNSMLEMWLSDNIELGYTPLEAPGDELNEPIDSRNGIISNLSLFIAPAFDNGKQIVSPSLTRSANRDFNKIKALYQRLTIPDKVVSSTLPVGQGNQRGFRQRAFFPRGSKIDN